MPLVFARDRTSGVLRCFFVAILVAFALLMRFSPPAGADDVVLASTAGDEAHKASMGVKRFSRAVLRAQNRQRRAHGLRPLRGSRSLGRAATRHARDMVRRNYFGHVSFGGRTVGDRVARTGYARRFKVGENLFYGLPRRPSPRKVVAAWMASPGHRHKMLNPAWQEVGIGAIMRPPFGARGGVTVVAVFGSRRAHRSAPAAALTTRDWRSRQVAGRH
jgi:uncharacterized protein YkwD